MLVGVVNSFKGAAPTIMGVGVRIEGVVPNATGVVVPFEGVVLYTYSLVDVWSLCW